MIDQFKSDLKTLTSTQMYRKYILNTHAQKIDDNMQLSLKEDNVNYLSHI